MIIDFWIYFKYCMNRTNSHVIIFTSILGLMTQVWILFKLYNFNQYWLIILAGIFVVFGMFLLGHWDVQYNVASKENSLSNRYNPELQTILEKVNRK